MTQDPHAELERYREYLHLLARFLSAARRRVHRSFTAAQRQRFDLPAP
jgi:hypothetical protein